MPQPTIPPTQYYITDNLKEAVRTVLSAGQEFVNGGAIRVNRSDTSAEVPRLEVDVTNVTRASTQMASYSVVVVSGAGTTSVNGTYYQTGTQNGRPSYTNAAGAVLLFDGDVWSLESGLLVRYTTTTDTLKPWDGTWINSNGSLPVPTVTGSDNWFYNHFAADLTIKIVSDRTNGGAIHHEDIVQRVRYLMAREAQQLVSPVVTWYDVLDVVEQGESHEVDAENREDHSTISFRLELGILPASYAVPSAGHAA